MNRQTTIIVRAFLHGLTGAGLFRRLNYPGVRLHTRSIRGRSRKSWPAGNSVGELGETE
jgi:hypothetical protein